MEGTYSGAKSLLENGQVMLLEMLQSLLTVITTEVLGKCIYPLNIISGTEKICAQWSSI